MVLNIFIYAIAVYGLTNMVVNSNGPLYLFKFIRQITKSISPMLGELFSCMMCLSTWVGLAFSLIDFYLVKDFAFTPFQMRYPTSEDILTLVLMDMFFASGITWLIHNVEEMCERAFQVYEDYVVEPTTDTKEKQQLND